MVIYYDDKIDHTLHRPYQGHIDLNTNQVPEIT